MRELVPSIGGILGARVSFRRNRWFISFQFDTEWNDGEVSDKATSIRQAQARKSAHGTSLDAGAFAAGTPGPERPVRALPRHPAAGIISGFDVGLIDAVVGLVAPRQNTVHPLIVRTPSPRRLNESDKRRRTLLRRERRLSRSILRARTKAARQDTTPVTAGDLMQVKIRLSRRQRRLSHLISNARGRLADQRQDFLHKLSTGIARSAEMVVIEDLHVRGMLANHCLAKSISDALKVGSAIRIIGEHLLHLGQRLLKRKLRALEDVRDHCDFQPTRYLSWRCLSRRIRKCV